MQIKEKLYNIKRIYPEIPAHLRNGKLVLLFSLVDVIRFLRKREISAKEVKKIVSLLSVNNKSEKEVIENCLPELSEPEYTNQTNQIIDYLVDNKIGSEGLKCIWQICKKIDKLLDISLLEFEEKVENGKLLSKD